jgi:hypothetical protein
MLDSSGPLLVDPPGVDPVNVDWINIDDIDQYRRQ